MASNILTRIFSGLVAATQNRRFYPTKLARAAKPQRKRGKGGNHGR